MQPKSLTRQPATVASAIFVAPAKHTHGAACLEHNGVKLAKPAVPKEQALQKLVVRAHVVLLEA